MHSMQNRNMYLYRRQGPKKRTKPGTPRKGRNQQKGLPNSARELLPLIQPATKALAQVLVGRTAASGQLNHARTMLAQAERLVSERAHNRLNPSEREEFFEQIARLKLTLSDADSEAEVQAAEEEVPVAGPAPVDRERLKEMALALTAPGGPKTYENRHEGQARHDDQAVADEDPSETESSEPVEVEEAAPAEAPKRSDDPTQLRLPRAGLDRIAIQPGTAPPRATNGRRRTAKPTAAKPAPTSAKTESVKTTGSLAATDVTVTDVQDETKVSEAKAGKSQKLPKGWIIDDDGFVVPGPA